MKPDLIFHSTRSEILNEAFSRQEYPIASNTSVIRLAFISGKDDRQFDACNDAFFELCMQNANWIKEGDTRQYRVRFAQTVLTWERHTEFVTLTWSMPASNEVYSHDIIAFVDCFKSLDLLVATKINIFDLPKEKIDEFEQTYDQRSFSTGFVKNQEARLSTDFQADENGFVTYDLGIINATPSQTGMLIRRILEFETYRIFTLLGLPTARAQMPQLAKLEERFSDLLRQTQNDDLDNDDKLARFQSLSLELDHIAQDNRFRFAATFAYAEIFWQRLKSLNFEKINDYRRPDKFIQRRMEPAISTCSRVKEREEELAVKINQAVDLINMQNNEKIQNQNTMILKSMNETSSRQYKLQKTVEGLSVIAISYYLIGLLSYVYPGMKEFVPLEKSLFLALCTPVVLFLVWLFIHFLKKGHSD